MAVLFDTRAYHRTLTDAGLPDAVADAHTRALEAAIEGGVATKHDLAEVKQALSRGIAEVKQDLSRDIAAVKQELSRDIAEVKQDLSRDIAAVKQDVLVVRKVMELLGRDLKIWAGGAAAALAGLIIGVIKLF